MTLRNYSAVTKKFLKAKFDCIFEQLIVTSTYLIPRVFQSLLCGKKKDEPKKKEQVKRAHESKLKAFIKRSSEPLLILQNTQHNQVVKEKVN